MVQSELEIFLIPESVSLPFEGFDLVVDPFDHGAGDLVTFPAGMSCTWKVRKPVKKHYKFG